MDEVNPGHDAAPAAPARAGDVLRTAREAQGLSLGDIGARTRIPSRHLAAIEASDYQSLPSATYAVGFAKAYARAVGADEVAIAQAVRADVDKLGRRVTEYVPQDIADPARVPSRGLAIVGVGLALALLIIAGLWYGTDLFRRDRTAQEVPAATPLTNSAAPAPAPAPSPTPVTAGKVVLTANGEVWLRVYDADNVTLKMGTLKPGESYEVPATAKGPLLNVGRPDKLSVTLDGKRIPPLGDGSRAIKDVRLDPQAIGARLSGASTAAAAPTPAVRTPLRERTERRSTRDTSGETGANALTTPAPSPSSATTAPADL
ncbi:helix-turn-helix domain-containing protein [Sphingomonas parapaucimobilis]|jgi:cytoskeleton protein RodZ|uniref:Putative Xre family DNA-binding protein n=1 Tax=Sphingomonas parapaucimobilis NBRC 15100 TaxID=1219049 RepID=A0A0A1W496_9SPHN|nr:helix-turn-helix domain-containing protein [Sphingomonas parapaucimobilis]GAM00022.1 putative Xre family DNA-binding protein [Sphingomonas parapaucimobilis NBRC 15100]